ncbi:hypothetical protein EN792_072360, partial [Mesorhizobium sp. M00.F.Ca.ET.149.01.1.1]
ERGAKALTGAGCQAPAPTAERFLVLGDLGLEPVSAAAQFGREAELAGHDVFQIFAEKLAESVDATDLRNVLSEIAYSFDLPIFAYLFPSPKVGGATDLISTYPPPWTSHYLRSAYEKIDPVIHRARSRQETFSWNAASGELGLSQVQQEFMDEAT